MVDGTRPASERRSKRCFAALRIWHGSRSRFEGCEICTIFAALENRRRDSEVRDVSTIRTSIIAIRQESRYGIVQNFVYLDSSYSSDRPSRNRPRHPYNCIIVSVRTSRTRVINVRRTARIKRRFAVLLFNSDHMVAFVGRYFFNRE